MTQLDWSKLLNSERRKRPGASVDPDETRTEIERDYDRILFSTPVRRLADKTQVFPLEKNDSVRTRLTHSHEVSNLARSIGTAIVFGPGSNIFDGILDAKRNVPALLAAIGLAHDIGNPPFGHQGEAAIGIWFKENAGEVFGAECPEESQYREDYLKFEGNAQALRIITKLQVRNDDFGMDLTKGTIAALMKYPVPSTGTDKRNVAMKKFGFFASERGVCDDVWDGTGLAKGIRHPLTFIMEASDDIAYSILDVEDAVKKGLVSFSDVMNALIESGDEAAKKVVLDSIEKHDGYKELGLSPSELNDVSMQRFRVFAMQKMVRDVVTTFLSKQTALMKGEATKDLLELSPSADLRSSLKIFALKHAYQHRSVLELELRGNAVIQNLMDLFWPAIQLRGDISEKPNVKKAFDGHPFESYVYGRISENYRRVYESPDNTLPLPYKKAQLLADMISGMTDNFAIDLENQLSSLKPQ